VINDKVLASKVSSLMLETSAKVNDSILTVKETCTSQEFDAYRAGCAKVLGYILIEILNPLYQAHPDLKPKNLK
jgi:hypothetical protein